jgi:DNA-binding response OmpR family regulator
MEGTAATILVAEDDGALARTLATRFEPQGYEVRWVRSVRDARIELRERPTDVLLLDSGLETEGLAFFQAVRFAPEAPRGGIVVLAEQNDTYSRERAQQLGAAAVMSKPVRLDDVVAVIEDLVSHL